jgi:hypothetical protein
MINENTTTDHAANDRVPGQPAPAKPIDERVKAVRAALQAELEGLGHRWEEPTPNGCGPKVDGVYIHLDIFEEGKGGWRRQHGNGRLRIKFGPWGDVRQFPEPKAGFDARKIAREISAYIKGCIARRTRERDLTVRTQANRTVADAINAELGLSRFVGLRADVDARTGMLVVRFGAACNEEQARALLAGARAILAKS